LVGVTFIYLFILATGSVFTMLGLVIFVNMGSYAHGYFCTTYTDLGVPEGLLFTDRLGLDSMPC
jgi:hypothetical protein